MRSVLLFSLCLLPAAALARQPASVGFGNAKLQCRALTCACGVCRMCKTQGEREACEGRAKTAEVRDTGENGNWHLNDDGAVVDEDEDD